MAAEGKDHRCKAKTKLDNPCRAAATSGGLCYFHANPKRASELGRIGGRRKRLFAAENSDPLPKLETATAVRDPVAQLVADVHAGKMNSRVAANLAPLLSLQLRAIETTDLERRLAKMERSLAKMQSQAGPNGQRVGEKKPNGSSGVLDFSAGMGKTAKP